MPITPAVTSSEWLEIGSSSVPLNTPAWKVTDYTALRRRTRVGENRVIPGMAGRLFVAREWDQQLVTLPMKITGRYDQEGTAYSDSFEGVDTNHQYLLDHVINVLGEQAVTFTDRQGQEWTGYAAVEDWQPSVDTNSGGDHMICFLSLSIAAGFLTATGS